MLKILVPISGGKDSQLCLQLAIEAHGKSAVRGLFCDTQFEHPLTYSHLEKMRHWYGMRTEESTEREARYKDRVSDELMAPHEFMPSKHKTIAIQLEKEIGKSVWTSAGGSMRNHPDQLCMLCMT